MDRRNKQKINKFYLVIVKYYLWLLFFKGKIVKHGTWKIHSLASMVVAIILCSFITFIFVMYISFILLVWWCHTIYHIITTNYYEHSSPLFFFFLFKKYAYIRMTRYLRLLLKYIFKKKRTNVSFFTGRIHVS
jgi:hypothetical protein